MSFLLRKSKNGSRSRGSTVTSRTSSSTSQYQTQLLLQRRTNARKNIQATKKPSATATAKALEGGHQIRAEGCFISMEEVIADLRVLEDQQVESKRKLANIRHTKEQRLQQNKSIENRLSKLKYSNGEMRGQLCRVRELLSQSRRQMGIQRLNAGNSADSLRSLDQKKKMALNVEHRNQEYQKKICSVLVIARAKSSLVRNSQKDFEVKERSLQVNFDKAKGRIELLRTSIIDEANRAREHEDKATKTRTESSIREVDLSDAQSVEATTKLRAEEVKESIRRETSRHDEEMNLLGVQVQNLQKTRKEEESHATQLNIEKELAKEVSEQIRVEGNQLIEDGSDQVRSPKQILALLEEERKKAMESLEVAERGHSETLQLKEAIQSKVDEVSEELRTVGETTATVRKDSAGMKESASATAVVEAKRFSTLTEKLIELEKAKSEVEELTDSLSALKACRDQACIEASDELAALTQTIGQKQSDMALYEEQISSNREHVTEHRLSREEEKAKRVSLLRDLKGIVARSTAALDDAKATADSLELERQTFERDFNASTVEHAKTHQDDQVEKLLNQYGELEKINFFFDSQKTADEQTDIALADLVRTCESRINTARKTIVGVRKHHCSRRKGSESIANGNEKKMSQGTRTSRLTTQNVMEVGTCQPICNLSDSSVSANTELVDAQLDSSRELRPRSREKTCYLSSDRLSGPEEIAINLSVEFEEDRREMENPRKDKLAMSTRRARSSTSIVRQGKKEEVPHHAESHLTDSSTSKGCKKNQPRVESTRKDKPAVSGMSTKRARSGTGIVQQRRREEMPHHAESHLTDCSTSKGCNKDQPRVESTRKDKPAESGMSTKRARSGTGIVHQRRREEVLHHAESHLTDCSTSDGLKKDQPKGENAKKDKPAVSGIPTKRARSGTSIEHQRMPEEGLRHADSRLADSSSKDCEKGQPEGENARKNRPAMSAKSKKRASSGTTILHRRMREEGLHDADPHPADSSTNNRFTKVQHTVLNGLSTDRASEAAIVDKVCDQSDRNCTRSYRRFSTYSKTDSWNCADETKERKSAEVANEEAVSTWEIINGGKRSSHRKGQSRNQEVCQVSDATLVPGAETTFHALEQYQLSSEEPNQLEEGSRRDRMHSESASKCTYLDADKEDHTRCKEQLPNLRRQGIKKPERPTKGDESQYEKQNPLPSISKVGRDSETKRKRSFIRRERGMTSKGTVTKKARDLLEASNRLSRARAERSSKSHKKVESLSRIVHEPEEKVDHAQGIAKASSTSNTRKAIRASTHHLRKRRKLSSRPSEKLRDSTSYVGEESADNKRSTSTSNCKASESKKQNTTPKLKSYTEVSSLAKDATNGSKRRRKSTCGGRASAKDFGRDFDFHF